MARTRLYWIKQGDGEASGPFTFPQIQTMWRAGSVKITDRIRRDDKEEWHSINIVQQHFDKGGGQLTVGKIVLAIVLALLVATVVFAIIAALLH